MSTHRRRRFVHSQVGWMLATIIVLALFEALTLELFFLVSLVGLLIITELTAPVNVTPGWRRPLKWIILVGLAVFGYFVIRWLVGLLPPGVI